MATPAPVPTHVRMDPYRRPREEETMLFAIAAGGANKLQLSRGPMPQVDPATLAAAAAAPPTAAAPPPPPPQQQQQQQQQQPPAHASPFAAQLAARIAADARGGAPTPQQQQQIDADYIATLLAGANAAAGASGLGSGGDVQPASGAVGSAAQSSPRPRSHRRRRHAPRSPLTVTTASDDYDDDDDEDDESEASSAAWARRDVRRGRGSDPKRRRHLQRTPLAYDEYDEEGYSDVVEEEDAYMYEPPPPPPPPKFRAPKRSPPRTAPRRLARSHAQPPAAEAWDDGATEGRDTLAPCSRHTHGSRASAQRCAVLSGQRRGSGRPRAPPPRKHGYAASVASGASEAAGDWRRAQAATAGMHTRQARYNYYDGGGEEEASAAADDDDEDGDGTVHPESVDTACTTPEEAEQIAAMEAMESDAIMSHMRELYLAKAITAADMPLPNDSLKVKAFKYHRAKLMSETKSKVDTWKSYLRFGSMMGEKFVVDKLKWSIFRGLCARLTGNMTRWDGPMREVYRAQHRKGGTESPMDMMREFAMQAVIETVTHNLNLERSLENGDSGGGVGDDAMRPATKYVYSGSAAADAPAAAPATTGPAPPPAAAAAASSFVASAVAGAPSGGGAPAAVAPTSVVSDGMPPKFVSKRRQGRATAPPAAGTAAAAAAASVVAAEAGAAGATEADAEVDAAAAALQQVNELKQQLQATQQQRDAAVAAAQMAADAAAAAVAASTAPASVEPRTPPRVASLSTMAAATMPPPPSSARSARSVHSAGGASARSARKAVVVQVDA